MPLALGIDLDDVDYFTLYFSPLENKNPSKLGQSRLQTMFFYLILVGA